MTKHHHQMFRRNLEVSRNAIARLFWNLRRNLLSNHLQQDTEWRAHKRMLVKQQVDNVQALVGSLQGTGQMSMRAKEMRSKSLLVLEDIFRSCKFIPGLKRCSGIAVLVKE